MKKVYFLSGLSESGKSQAGQWATKNAVFRLKIIYFRNLLLKQLNLDGSQEEQERLLGIWHKGDLKMFEEFRNLVDEFMTINKCEAISLESLYGPELARSFLTDPRFETKILFIEANLELRAKREYQKLFESNNDISYEEVLNLTKQKDERKISFGILETRKIATDLIDNNGTLEQYKKKSSKFLLKINH